MTFTADWYTLISNDISLDIALGFTKQNVGIGICKVKWDSLVCKTKLDSKSKMGLFYFYN